MKRFRLNLAAGFGVVVLLLGVAGLTSPLSLRMQPWSWRLYWRTEGGPLLLAMGLIAAGFVLWRQATKELQLMAEVQKATEPLPCAKTGSSP